MSDDGRSTAEIWAEEIRASQAPPLSEWEIRRAAIIGRHRHAQQALFRRMQSGRYDLFGGTEVVKND
jgi:hypothetical protein